MKERRRSEVVMVAREMFAGASQGVFVSQEVEGKKERSPARQAGNQQEGTRER